MLKINKKLLKENYNINTIDIKNINEFCSSIVYLNNNTYILKFINNNSMNHIENKGVY